MNKLVPLEPTEQMATLGMMALSEYSVSRDYMHTSRQAIECYKAMLAAAPADNPDIPMGPVGATYIGDAAPADHTKAAPQDSADSKETSPVATVTHSSVAENIPAGVQSPTDRVKLDPAGAAPDTPETDAYIEAAYQYLVHDAPKPTGVGALPPMDFARSLERRLLAVTEERDELCKPSGATVRCKRCGTKQEIEFHYQLNAQELRLLDARDKEFELRCKAEGESDRQRTRADEAEDRVRELEGALAWYGERAEALKRYGDLKKDNAMMAVVTELMLDNGARAKESNNG